MALTLAFLWEQHLQSASHSATFFHHFVFLSFSDRHILLVPVFTTTHFSMFTSCVLPLCSLSVFILLVHSLCSFSVFTLCVHFSVFTSCVLHAVCSHALCSTYSMFYTPMCSTISVFYTLRVIHFHVFFTLRVLHTHVSHLPVLAGMPRLCSALLSSAVALTVHGHFDTLIVCVHFAH